MVKGIIGKKIGMTQIFDEKGNVIPVTVILAGPCSVTQKKTKETDGYDAIQLGFMDVAEKKLTKAEAGHFKKNGISAKKHLKEFRLDDIDQSLVSLKLKLLAAVLVFMNSAEDCEYLLVSRERNRS